jgi:threonyl-tRNA synthetase
MTPIKEARRIFVDREEDYKIELIDDLIEKGETSVGLYHHEE